ncbi:MAG TPA: hypothetical protein VJ875_07705 [Pyrinomonadaceae bacterium]|nr:hypothetical protein [Pyrinomonadaceae bacterium]
MSRNARELVNEEQFRLSGKTQVGGRLTQYLLGTLSESERESIESEYFADEDAFEQMLIAEDELIDAYARNELSAQERRQFEENFLNSSPARERVHFARALTGAVAEARRGGTTQVVTSKSSPGFFGSVWRGASSLRIAGVAIVVILTAGSSWLLVERAGMRRELQELRAERATLNEKSETLQRSADAERARSAELTAQLQIERERSQAIKSNQAIARRASGPVQKEYVAGQSNITNDVETQEFSLTSGSTRGGAGHELKINSKANFIRLRLNLETEASYPEYRASLETAEGRVVNSFYALHAPQSNRESINLPSVRVVDLHPGDYVLLLSGKRADGTFEPVANYSFRVARR